MGVQGRRSFDWSTETATEMDALHLNPTRSNGIESRSQS